MIYMKWKCFIENTVIEKDQSLVCGFSVGEKKECKICKAYVNNKQTRVANQLVA